MNERSYDIDWLRVITIGLLIIYHTSAIFQPWGKNVGVIQNKITLESIWIPMSMINVWRIPLLFFVSGMGIAFSLRKRNWEQLIKERIRRILIPLIIGVFLIVPIHKIIYQKFYNLDITYHPTTAHLWFLANIFAYVIILSPFIIWLKKTTDSNKSNWFLKALDSPICLLFITASFMLEGFIINPKYLLKYAMSVHGFSIGFVAFFWGYCCTISGMKLFETIIKLRWIFAISALILFIIRFVYWDLKSPSYLFLFESSIWIYTIFGFAAKHFNKSSITLSYLSTGAYPIYIWHMVFLYLSSYFLIPLNISVWLKFILIITITLIGCFATYELLIRRINIIKPLFGLK